MRTWRVGSISMGSSLLFLGILLLVSQLIGLNVTTIFIVWWPVILIVLGIEILFFIYFAKSEKSFVKYDFLSILFVGSIGTIAIGLTVLSTTGMLDKVNAWTSLENTVFDLPEYNETIDKDIKRIVLDTGSYPITIEDAPGKDVNIFGTYHVQTTNREQAITTVNDYLSYTQKGDTLYIALKDIYHLTEPFQEWVHVSATVLVPSDVKVEIDGNHNVLEVQTRNISEDWIINHGSQVNFSVHETADVNIVVETNDTANDQQSILRKGSHTISVYQADDITINEF